MTSMHAVALLLCTAALTAFAWGMRRFFETASGYTARTHLVAAAGLLSAVCHWHAIWTATTGWLSACLAAHLYLAAIALFVWTVRSCGRLRLTPIFERDLPRWLAHDGPYRFVRHPFYVAYTVSWIAGVIASRSWLALASTSVMIAIYVIAAVREERKFAASPLAAAYAAYRTRTGFMWPRLPRLGHSDPDRAR